MLPYSPEDVTCRDVLLLSDNEYSVARRCNRYSFCKYSPLWLAKRRKERSSNGESCVKEVGRSSMRRRHISGLPDQAAAEVDARSVYVREKSGGQKLIITCSSTAGGFDLCWREKPVLAGEGVLDSEHSRQARTGCRWARTG